MQVGLHIFSKEQANYSKNFKFDYLVPRDNNELINLYI